MHKIYLLTMASIVVFVLIYLTFSGFAYYQLSLEDRFFHNQHQLLKPSGWVGHGLGIIGSLLIFVGVSIYMLRKRIRIFSRIGLLKHWLEFHIFLCTLGPVLVLFHTAFKFGGVVAVSFWSMVAVVLSGVIGRYIYLQIPRTLEGRVLSLQELDLHKAKISEQMREVYNLNEFVLNDILDSVKKRPDRTGKNMILRFWNKFRFEVKLISVIKKQLKGQQLSSKNYKKIMMLVRKEIVMNRKIDRLKSMQQLFRYWHVAHLPFAIIMMIIMIVHVAVTVAFGYKWIF